MNSEELHSRLQASERKRSMLIVELGHAKMELQAANLELQGHRERQQHGYGYSSSSPHGVEDTSSSQVTISQLKDRLARSEKERVSLAKRLAHNQPGVAVGADDGTSFVNTRTMEGGPSSSPSALGGLTSIMAVEEATDADFAFKEEEEARAAAEELMAQLLHLKRSLQLAKTELSEVRMELTEQVSEVDAAKARELGLSQLVDQYQGQVQQLLGSLRQQPQQGEINSSHQQSYFASDGTVIGAIDHNQQIQNNSALSASTTLVLGGKLTETQVRDLEKKQYDLTEALERLQEELLVEQCRRRSSEDELQRAKIFMASGDGGGRGDAGSAATMPDAAGKHHFTAPLGGNGGGVEGELRRQVQALSGTYTKQLSHCTLQDDMIKKLRGALKDKMIRVTELETLIKAQQMASSQTPSFPNHLPENRRQRH